MAGYDRLIFNQVELKNKVLNICETALTEACNIIQQNEWFANGQKERIELGEGHVQYVLSANDIKAWIVEYGSGSNADINRNPYWNDYVQGSDYYNNYRNGSSDIYTWDDGDTRRSLWASAFDREVHLHGGKGGRNVSDKYEGDTATPFLQDLLDEAYQAFVDKFNELTSAININDYFMVTRVQV